MLVKNLFLEEDVGSGSVGGGDGTAESTKTTSLMPVGAEQGDYRDQEEEGNDVVVEDKKDKEDKEGHDSFSDEHGGFQAYFIHRTIHELLQIAPLYAGILMQSLEDHAPHSRLSRSCQRLFVLHALRMTEYVPALLYRILVIVVDRMVAIDVAIKLEDVVRERRALEREKAERVFDDLEEEEEEEEEEEKEIKENGGEEEMEE